MAEAPAATRSDNGTPPSAPPTAEKRETRTEALARTLEEKRRQGFEIESQTDTEAVLVMKGRRKWFGLYNGPSVRYSATVDESGNANTRRI